MASLTIDQLKKSLNEQGVTLPPAGSKKAEYVKLYEQYSTLNENLGDTYSSDDETNSRTDSQNVSSSTSPSKTEAVVKEVEKLSDDDLYNKLREFGQNVGPVLVNTRRVYEKKLIKLITSGRQTNGYDTVNSHDNKNDEFSDSDVELSKLTTRKSSRKSPAPRDSPKPSGRDNPDTKSQSEYSSSSVKRYQDKPKTTFTYIEKIDKRSSERFIEPTSDSDFLSSTSSTLRSRFSSSYGNEEPYIGKWEPSLSRFGVSQFGKSTKGKTQGTTNWAKNIIGGVLLAVLLLLAVYIYYQWSATDPYKLIEDDVEKEINKLTENKEKN